MTQVLSSTLAARLPAMWRSATLAIEVSSTSMKVAMRDDDGDQPGTALAGRRAALRARPSCRLHRSSAP